MMVISFALPAFSQSYTPFGIKGGLNIANIQGDDWGESDPLVGACVGIFTSIGINDVFSLQPEVLFTMKGAKTDYSPYFLLIEKDTLYYIEFPFLAKFTLPNESNVHLSLYGGLSLGFLLGTKYELKGVDAILVANMLGVNTEGTFEDLGLNTSPFELGFVFGAGISHDLTKGAFIVDMRYNIGMTDILDVTPAFDAKNGVFSIMTGYAFK